MRTQVVVYEFSESDLRHLIRSESSAAVAPVVAAIDEIRLSAPVIGHRQLARLMEVSVETVLNWINAEALPASKQGRIYFVAKDDLYRWLMRHKHIKAPGL